MRGEGETKRERGNVGREWNAREGAGEGKGSIKGEKKRREKIGRKVRGMTDDPLTKAA